VLRQCDKRYGPNRIVPPKSTTSCCSGNVNHWCLVFVSNSALLASPIPQQRASPTLNHRYLHFTNPKKKESGARRDRLTASILPSTPGCQNLLAPRKPLYLLNNFQLPQFQIFRVDPTQVQVTSPQRSRDATLHYREIGNCTYLPTSAISARQQGVQALHQRFATGLKSGGVAQVAASTLAAILP